MMDETIEQRRARKLIAMAGRIDVALTRRPDDQDLLTVRSSIERALSDSDERRP